MKGIISGLVGRTRGSESGFTLIEMLIVVGIIVALAAAIVPQVIQFGGKGEEGKKEGKKDQEKAAIQVAMDSMVADNNISAVTANGSGTASRNDWTSYPTGAGTVTLDGYLRVTSTEFYYCWDTKGKITDQLEKTNGVPTCP